MAAELVDAATSTNLAEMDWGKNIEICELAANDQKACREVIRALKKRLSNANSNTQLYAVTLLELLMNNIGERIQKQVIESGVLPVLVRMVASKNDSPVRERIFLLLDATQSSLGGQNGKFPEYYSAYYDLVSAGVKFPQRVQPTPSERLAAQATTNRSSNPISQPNNRAHSNAKLPSSGDKPTPVPVSQSAPESSIIQKASNALEVLRDVLDAADANNPSAVKDEFTLDLVEQCSFQKQRVMHLVLTSRNEKVISQAIELNDKLQKVLDRHEAIVSGRSDVRVTAVRSNHEFLNEELEEEEEQLIQRIRKGKACMMSESTQRFPQRDLYEQRIVAAERQSRPIIRPMTVDPPPEEPRPTIRPMTVDPPPEEPSRQQQHPHVGIPPPPSKHVERQKFFKENKVDGPAGQMKGLSLHDGRNGNDSDSSEDLSLSD